MNPISSLPRWLVPVALALLLASCATPPPRDGAGLEERSRVNPTETQPAAAPRLAALRMLEEAAGQARAEGDLDGAEALLQRGLKLDHQDGALLQELAEVQLAQGRWQQAESHALRAAALAGQDARRCHRAWETVALAREADGRIAQMAEAHRRAAACGAGSERVL